MAEPQFSTHPDDDLPRTIRRERDARQRNAAPQVSSQASYAAPANGHAGADHHPPGEGPAVTVTALDIPFFRLMAFCLKVVFAAIPALILLGLMLYAGGKVAELFFPWLLKAKVIVEFR